MIRPHISEDRIRERAYLLWLEEGQPQGKDAEHWQKARELLALEAEPVEGKNGDAAGEQAIPGKRRPTASKSKPAASRKQRLM